MHHPQHSPLPALVVTLLLIASLAGCEIAEQSASGNSPQLETRCQSPRPEICTKEYRPVCGLREDGSWQTYGNACTACADEPVVGHHPGECGS